MESHSNEKSNFIDHGVNVCGVTMTTIEFDRYFDELLDIHPSILGTTVLEGGNDIEIKRRNSERGPNESSNRTQFHVGYRVCRIFDEENEKFLLSFVYVLRNAKVISTLLGFLEELDIDNYDDLKDTIDYLKKVHSTISN